MRLTVSDIAKLVDGAVKGDGSVEITGVAGLAEAGTSDVSFLKDAKKAKDRTLFDSSQAGAVFVGKDFPSNGRTLIEVENPQRAFSKILEQVDGERNPVNEGIDSQASIAKGAQVSPDAHVGPFCVVEEGAVVEAGAVLVSNVYVGRHAFIGAGTRIYPHVTIRHDVKVGKNCILHANSVLGSDGYGFFFENGQHNKIPQVGNVIVEDNVEIGSGTTIDRATTGSTFIRKGAKIDNLVQVAHNVDVGEHSLLVAQVGIAGSTKIGKGVVLAGQVGVADHATIGDGSQVGAQSGVKGNVKPGSVLFGSPAQPIMDTIKQSLLIQKLPALFKDVKKLKEKMSSK